MANARAVRPGEVNPGQARARETRGFGALFRLRPAGRWPTPVRVVVAAVLVLWLVYLLVANLLIGTGILKRSLNGDADELSIGYAEAWTIVPGSATVTDFTLRFQDKNVQFHLALDRASIRVDLLALLSKEFHVTRVRAEGASAKMRGKVEDPKGQEARLAAFPRIEGYADPPLKAREPEGAPEKPTPPADRFWTIHIEDVAASVRELWFLEARWTGVGTVRGAFRLVPMRELDVFPAELDLAEGDLSVASAPILHLRPSKVFTTVHHVDVRVPKGLEILRFVDARIRLHGEVPSITPLTALYGDDPRVGGGVGELDVDVAMNRGVLAHGGSLRLDLVEAYVQSARVGVRGPVALRAEVAEASALALDVRTTKAMLATGSEAAATIGVGFVRARIAAADLVTPPPPDELLLAGGVELRDVSAPDLTKLQPLLPEGVLVRGGGAGLAARASLTKRALEGRVDLALTRARVRFGDAEMGASGKVWANIATDDVAKAIAFPSSGLSFTDVSVASGGARAEGIAVDVRAPTTTVLLPSGTMSSTLSLRATPGARVLEAASSLAGAPQWLARAAAGPEATAELRLRKTPVTTELRVVDARDGIVRARGMLRDGKTGMRGVFLVEAGPLHAGVSLPPGGGSADLVPFADGGWLESRIRALP